MFIQFLSTITFTVPRKDVIKVIRGTIAREGSDHIQLTPRSVVEMVDSKARKLIKQYPRQIESWGVDAMPKREVVKGKNSKSKGTGRS